jgi:hypothetical protein
VPTFSRACQATAVKWQYQRESWSVARLTARHAGLKRQQTLRPHPVLGDQFEQKDQRIVSGLTIDHKMTDQWFGRDVINDFGLQVRNDYIMDIALNHTHQRNVYAQLTDDRVIETSVSEYFENRIQFTDWFRTVAGLRGDFFTAAVTDKLGGPNSGTASSFLASPKLQMIFGPWFNTELYFDGGFGFHSNDARGTTTVENPAAEGGGRPPRSHF